MTEIDPKRPPVDSVARLRPTTFKPDTDIMNHVASHSEIRVRINVIRMTFKVIRQRGLLACFMFALQELLPLFLGETQLRRPQIGRVEEVSETFVRILRSKTRDGPQPEQRKKEQHDELFSNERAEAVQQIVEGLRTLSHVHAERTVQRREAAAPVVAFVSARTGCLPFAAPSGSVWVTFLNHFSGSSKSP